MSDLTKLALIFAIGVFGSYVGASANEFTSTKQKDGVNFAFTDVTTIKRNDGVAFSLIPEESTSLEVRYSFNDQKQTIFTGNIQSKTAFELPGDSKNIYLEQAGVHTFTRSGIFCLWSLFISNARLNKFHYS